MSRMNEVMQIANEIAQDRGSDTIPPNNLWLRCSEHRIFMPDFRMALSQAIKLGRMRETGDGQLLLLRS